MAGRFIGGIISATAPVPTTLSASGVWTLKEAEYYQQAGTWPNGSGLDPYFRYTTLLLHGDGTNGAQNNTFLDGSTNNYTITRNGNATQGSSTPYFYPGCWSDYYAATSSGWQTPANSASTILGGAFNSTSTFTVEAWIYPLSRHSGGGAVLGYVFGQMQLAGSSVDWSFGPDSNGNLVLFWYNAGNQISKGGSVIPLNTWTHIALSISSGAIKMFVNGVQETLTGLTSTTASSTVTNYCSSGGYLYAGTTWQGFNGYISNLRVVKQALYSANFTPSVSPLTAIANTSLLTCNNQGFVDQSSLNNALTVTGSVAVSRFSSFSAGIPYSAATYAGSIYLDGNGDYLNLPAATGFALGTSDFTMEAWVYPTARVTNSSYIVAQSSYGVGSDFGFWITSTGILQFYMLTGGAGNIVASTGTVPLNAWTHVAVSRSGTSFKLFINGVTDGTLTGSQNITNSFTPATIGNSTNNTGSVYFQGYLANLRVVKGTAVYTANFTPPTTPVTAITNTQLLLNAANGGIFDNTTIADLETVGNVQISTAVTKYGTGSIAFDGSGDYLITDAADVNAYAFGSGDFTIEMWVYPTAGTSRMLYDGRPSSAVSLSPTIYINASNVLAYYTNGADRITGASLTLNTWSHIAVVRSSGSTKMYINGTQSGSTYADTNVYVNAATRPIIGADGGNVASQNYAGYIDELRVTKGIARYTTNFTPSGPFPNF